MSSPTRRDFIRRAAGAALADGWVSFKVPAISDHDVLVIG